MNPQIKAKDILQKVLKYYGGNDILPIHKLTAEMIVNEIVDGIDTATGHLTLKRNDLLELNSDLLFWDRVKKEIEKS